MTTIFTRHFLKEKLMTLKNMRSILENSGWSSTENAYVKIGRGGGLGRKIQKLFYALAVTGTLLYSTASLHAQANDTYTSNQNGNWTSPIWDVERDYVSGGGHWESVMVDITDPSYDPNDNMTWWKDVWVVDPPTTSPTADYPGQLSWDDVMIEHQVTLNSNIAHLLDDLIVNTNGVLNFTSGTFEAENVENIGRINLSGNANLNFSSYLENDPGATIDVTGNAKILATTTLNYYGKTIENVGTINIHDTVNSEIAGIVNDGTVNVTNGSVKFNGNSQNTRGTGTIENAEVTFENGFNTGDYWGNSTNAVTTIKKSKVTTGNAALDSGSNDVYGDLVVLAGATLNITDSEIKILGRGIYESEIVAQGTGATATITNSSITHDAPEFYVAAVDGGKITLDHSSVTADSIDIASGTIELRNKTTVTGDLYVGNYYGGDSTVTAENKLLVRGAGNKIDGNVVYAADSTSTFIIEGQNKDTDFLTITGDIRYEDSSVSVSTFSASAAAPASSTFNFGVSNLTVDVSPSVLEALATNDTLTIGQGTKFTNVVLAGQGSNTINFVLNKDSGIRSDAGKTFNAKTIETTDSFLYVGVDQSGDVGKISADSIALNGTTTVILLNTDNANTSNIVVKTDDIFDSSNVKIGNDNYVAADADKTKVSGENKIAVTTTESNSSKLIITSATGNKNGETVNEFDLDVDASGDVVADANVTDTPDNDSGKPISGTTNVATLKTVLASPELQRSQLQQQIGQYAGSDNAKIEEALAQIDPAIAAVTEGQTVDAVSRFIHAGGRRTSNLLESSSRNLSYVADNNMPNSTILGQECDPCAPCGGRNFSRQLWFEGLGGWQNQSTTGVDGFTSDVGGFALGVDRHFDRNTILGVAFGGEFTSVKSKNGLNSAKADTLLVEFYGGRRFDDWFLSFSGGYAGSDWKTNRSAPFIDAWAKGKHDADAYFENVELSYRIGNKKRYLTPFIAYDFIQYREDAYTETGNGVFETTFAKRKTDAYLQTLGFRAGRTIRRNGIVWTPELTAGWLHDYGAGNVYTTGSFVAGGSPFVLLGTSRNINRGVLGLSLNAELSKQTSLTFRYDGEFTNHYNAQYLTGGINVSF
jgi:uncharacterized protein with beta-barrel porin domain